jgi:hypothetical protein
MVYCVNTVFTWRNLLVFSIRYGTTGVLRHGRRTSQVRELVCKVFSNFSREADAICIMYLYLSARHPPSFVLPVTSVALIVSYFDSFHLEMNVSWVDLVHLPQCCSSKSALKMETVRFSETLVSTYKFTRRYNQEKQQRQLNKTDSVLQNHSRVYATRRFVIVFIHFRN